MNFKRSFAISISILFFLSQVHSQCKEGNCINGKGRYAFTNGGVYSGQFSNGKLHGNGQMNFKSGDVYFGQWLDNIRSGKGKMKFKNGDVYLGYWDNNLFHGNGRMTYHNRDYYDGEWNQNIPEGKGKFMFRDGEYFEGDFVNGQFEGQGIFYYKDGTRYDGQWKLNKRHGYGTQTNKQSKAQQGDWEDDTFLGESSSNGSLKQSKGNSSDLRDCGSMYCANGTGSFEYQDGSKYVGDFKLGNAEGFGKCNYVSGNVYEGEWKNHAPHGEGIMSFTDGTNYVARWENGHPVQMLTQINVKAQEEIQDDFHHDEVNIYAMIVGVSNYTHMPSLKYTDDDAYHFYAFLKSPEGGALRDDRIKILIDDSANRKNILSSMKSLYERADDNDVVIFFYSGHGLNGAFIPSDYDGYRNKLLFEEVTDILDDSDAKHKLLIADACHSGGAVNYKGLDTQMNDFYKEYNKTSGGTAFLLSSKGEEVSLEYSGIRQGVFSHYLIRGLKGEADKNMNNIVTITELYNFLYSSVQAYTNTSQTPVLNGQFDINMPLALVRQDY